MAWGQEGLHQSSSHGHDGQGGQVIAHVASARGVQPGVGLTHHQPLPIRPQLRVCGETLHLGEI